MIKIALYDDNFEWRQSLKTLLSLNDEYILVIEKENCCEVEMDIETYMPEIVLMDINMPICDGIEGLRKIKNKHPQIKVLMQTAFDDDEKIFSSLKNGASGYILKSDNSHRILQAVDEVYQGGAAMNPAVAMRVLEYFKPQLKENPLTGKENQVLSLLSKGRSYKMIADEMGISYTTVNSHTKNIYVKLHISSLGEAVAWYYQNGGV
jgi:DNA-binding NarL/FixJ family response regulator